MDMRLLVENTLTGLGYELVDMVATPRGGIQLFIDRLDTTSGGVTIEDCVKVSNQLTNLFLVENINYERLEVSSPGLDRPLKKASDFERFAGKKVKVKLRVAIDNHKRLTGKLKGLQDDVLTVEVDGRDWSIPMNQVDRVNLEPEF
ncbi:ribosome maturation factor RimP [Leeia oryzae]|uniref:ribosome maturation factor RimP n=1 Tax=Leeia oryzae TaxID=356662 RepID=UPI00037DFC8C|nr:ribosome maturation factor RimP [Leeia oryzae]